MKKNIHIVVTNGDIFCSVGEQLNLDDFVYVMARFLATFSLEKNLLFYNHHEFPICTDTRESHLFASLGHFISYPEILCVTNSVGNIFKVTFRDFVGNFSSSLSTHSYWL